MRRHRSRAALLSRLERLESCAAVASRERRLRFGHLRRLPPDYKGEKHVVVAKQLPSRDGREWVEFEEMPGPDPNPSPKVNPGDPEYFDIVLVYAYPIQAEAQRCP